MTTSAWGVDHGTEISKRFDDRPGFKSTVYNKDFFPSKKRGLTKEDRKHNEMVIARHQAREMARGAGAGAAAGALAGAAFGPRSRSTRKAGAVVGGAIGTTLGASAGGVYGSMRGISSPEYRPSRKVSKAFAPKNDKQRKNQANKKMIGGAGVAGLGVLAARRGGKLLGEGANTLQLANRLGGPAGQALGNSAGRVGLRGFGYGGAGIAGTGAGAGLAGSGYKDRKKLR